MRLPRFQSDDVDRFWSRVDRRGTDECWPWIGNRNALGYGEFYSGRSIGAHRYSLMLATGRHDAARDQFACHACDNPPCVNPAHLRWGSAKDNAVDTLSRGRLITKITRDVVVAILNDPRPQVVIARELGVNKHTISDIKTGRSWAQVHAEKVGVHRDHRNKLDPEKVAIIRALFERGHRERGAVPLADRFGVSEATIRDIIMRRSWNQEVQHG